MWGIFPTSGAGAGDPWSSTTIAYTPGLVRQSNTYKSILRSQASWVAPEIFRQRIGDSDRVAKMAKKVVFMMHHFSKFPPTVT